MKVGDIKQVIYVVFFIVETMIFFFCCGNHAENIFQYANCMVDFSVAAAQGFIW